MLHGFLLVGVTAMLLYCYYYYNYNYYLYLNKAYVKDNTDVAIFTAGKTTLACSQLWAIEYGQLS